MSTAKILDFSAAQKCRSSRMENQKHGHFALFRSLLSKEWAKDTAKLAMWVRLIGEAAYKPRTVDFAGQQWQLKPGELVTTAAIMGRKLRNQDGTEKSPQAVTRMINFFEREGMITKRGNRFGTVICIKNYAEYQIVLSDEPRDKPSENNKPSNSKASCAVTDEPRDKPSDEQNKKLLEQELKKYTPLPPSGVSAGRKKSSVKKTIPYQAVLDAYNEAAANRLPAAETLNDKRKRGIKRLLSELNEPTVEAARNYFEAFMRSARPFYFGDNDRGWRAGFDYLLRSDTLIKTREDNL